MLAFFKSVRGVRAAGVLLMFVVVTSAVLARHVVAPPDQVVSARQQTLVGMLRPSDVVSLTLPAAASVEAVLAAAGDEVAEGQPLVRLDVSDIMRELKQLMLDIERSKREIADRNRTVLFAEEALARLQSGDTAWQVAQAERDAQLVPMRQAKDSPERAQVLFEQATLRASRMDQLASQGLVSKQDVEEAHLALRLASDDLKNARKAAETADRLKVADEAQMRVRRAGSVAEAQRQVAEQRAVLEQSRMALSQAELRFDAVRQRGGDGYVRAPHAGAIVEMLVQAGDRVAAGAPVVRVASIDPMTIDVDVAPLVVNTIAAGDAATVDIPGMNLVGLKAQVRSVSPTPADSGKYLVQLTLANPSRARLAGQAANVTLVATSRPAR